MNLPFSQTLMSVMKNLTCVISTLHVRTQLEVMNVTASVDSQGMVSIAQVSYAYNYTCVIFILCERWHI